MENFNSPEMELEITRSINSAINSQLKKLFEMEGDINDYRNITKIFDQTLEIMRGKYPDFLLAFAYFVLTSRNWFGFGTYRCFACKNFSSKNHFAVYFTGICHTMLCSQVGKIRLSVKR